MTVSYFTKMSRLPRLPSACIPKDWPMWPCTNSASLVQISNDRQTRRTVSRLDCQMLDVYQNPHKNPLTIHIVTRSTADAEIAQHASRWMMRKCNAKLYIFHPRWSYESYLHRMPISTFCCTVCDQEKGNQAQTTKEKRKSINRSQTT